MDIEKFKEKRPYLYHLTAPENIPQIIKQRKLFSTQYLVNQSTLSQSERVDFLRSKRSGHKKIIVDGIEVFIRDQDPISMKSLAKATTELNSPEDFLEILNERVFFWPTIKDLNIHFKRYEGEKPTILRFSTSDIISLNTDPEFCFLNSGAPRCIAHYGGKPAPRNRHTFKTATHFERTYAGVREFTILSSANLPENIWTSDSPDGPWKLINS